MAIPRTNSTEPAVNARQRELARRIQAYATVEGIHAAPWPGLEVMRADRPTPRTAVVYQPCVCLVAQGGKKAYLGSERFTYDAMHYLVLSVPLPIEAKIVTASPERPFLAVRLRLDATALSKIMLDTDLDTGPPPGNRRGISVSPISDVLNDAFCRLIGALDDPRDKKVLAPLAEREILYRLLTGEQGSRVRNMALRDSQSHRIAQVLKFIQSHYDQPLDVRTIAESANMSPSTLHHAFKSVTSSSPVQYLKKIRLHRARLLMLNDGLGAGDAAHRVGYGSEFQFSREYRRLFGDAPARDVATLRAESVATIA